MGFGACAPISIYQADAPRSEKRAENSTFFSKIQLNCQLYPTKRALIYNLFTSSQVPSKSNVRTLSHWLSTNQSLHRYRANRYEEDNFLSSFFFLLTSCFSFVLYVAHYTKNKLQTTTQQSKKICSASNHRFGLTRACIP